MYGFFSTSEDKNRSKKFMNNEDGIMFVIHLPEMHISKDFENYDHGFVDMNYFKLSAIEVEK